MHRYVQPGYRENSSNHAIDFLLVRRKKKWILREMPAIYTVGQQQPLSAVPSTRKDSVHDYLKLRLKVFLLDYLAVTFIVDSCCFILLIILSRRIMSLLVSHWNRSRTSLVMK